MNQPIHAIRYLNHAENEPEGPHVMTLVDGEQNLSEFFAKMQAEMAPEPAIHFTVEEYASRLSKLRSAMAADGIDVVLLSSPEAQCWLHGLALRWYKAHGPREWRPLITTAVHVDHDRFILFDGAEHQEAIRRTSMASDVRLLPRAERAGMLEFMVGELKKDGWLGGTTGLELYSYVPSPAVHSQIRGRLEAEGCTIVDATDAVRRVRLVKSAAELECIEKAAVVCDAGITALRKELRVGMTELQAWSIMMSAMVDAGGEPSALHETSFIGHYAAHTWSTDRAIQAGHLLNVDPCGVVNRYHSNRTGLFFIGEPPAEYVELMKRLAGAFEVFGAAAKAGTPVREVNAVMRQYYQDVGLWRYKEHSWVGGYELGLSFPPDWVGNWLFTIDDEETDDVFEAGMVTNFESVVHIPLIDTVIYEAGGARTLSSLPLDELIVIDA